MTEYNKEQSRHTLILLLLTHGKLLNTRCALSVGVVRWLRRPSVDPCVVCFVDSVIRQGGSLVFPDWKTFCLKNIGTLAMQHK